MGFFGPGEVPWELLLPQDSRWGQFFAVVHWIQAVTATLSIMGSSSIIGYTIFQNTARSPEVRPLVYLSLSDLFLGFWWLTGALLDSSEASHPTGKGDICYNLQVTGQVSKYSNHLGRIGILLSSLIPIFLMVPVLGLGNHFHCPQNFTTEHGCLLLHIGDMLSTESRQVTCFVLHLYSTGVFLVSFMVSFLAILTLLVRARMLYKRFVNSMGYVGDQQWAMLKVVEHAVVLYPVVFLCCWGPAFILGIVKLTPMDNVSAYMALYVLEALTASSQGFLNCLVYGWTQHMFHCVKRKACRDIDTQTPLLRSQKRFYASTLPAHSQTGAKPPSPATTTVL
ncbi:transmembrane protein 116 isoform X2 [Erythrolamprus reginae]|uniref:transmembrane protein 116 isoform X2 n=1 Tax=Erythrolamprus reginae TaxID=121349 RepID=UPI00396C4C5A